MKVNIEVANCLSGAPGCAVLSNAEISVLLLGTESSSTYVREAVFKALLLLTDVIPSKDDEHTHIYIYICVCVCVCVVTDFTELMNVLVHH